MSNAAKKVGGLPADVLSEKAIDAALAELGLKDAKKKPIAEKVSALQTYFATIPEDEAVDCDRCNGTSSAKLSVCPFCGEGGMNDAGPAPGMVEPDDDDGEREAIQDEEPEDADVPPADYAEPEETKPEPEEAKPAPSGKLVKLDRKNRKQKASGEAAEAIAEVVSPKDIAKQDGLAQLAEQEREYHELVKAGAKHVFQLATHIQKMHDTGFWKLKPNPETPGEDYGRKPNFAVYAGQELGLSRKYVQQLQLMSVRFSKEQFEEFGKKLRYVLAAPKEDQDEILAMLKNGAGGKGPTKEEIQAEVAKRRQEKGLPSRGKHAAKEKANAAILKGSSENKKGVLAPKPEDDRLTIAVLPNKKIREMLYKQPTKPGDAKVQARRIADGPWMELDLSNDVKMYVTVIIGSNGGLQAVVEFKRVEV